MDETMDPNATLAELREWANKEPVDEQERRAMELFAALDEWLSKGGFLPDEWYLSARESI